jgi:hypothetical protein
VGVRILLVDGRLSERGGAPRWLLGVVARLRGHADTVLAVGVESPSPRSSPIPEIRR